MHVRKRNGSYEAVDLNKIVGSISRVCADLGNIDVFKVATKTVGGLVDGVSTRELDQLSIRNAVGLIIEDPVYSKVAARLLSNFILKEIDGQDIQSFSQSIQIGFDQGLINKETYDLVMSNKRKLNAAIKHERDWYFEFHGIQTVYDRYLLKHPSLVLTSDDGKKQRAVIETPQYFMMRVACGLSADAAEAVELYNLMSSLEYMASTPTLFNSGTVHNQMSSCYLLDSPLDSLEDIYKRYSDIASLSKYAGGIGVSASRIRSKGRHIKGTNGKSNGLVPWLHTLSGSVAAVNQCLHPDTKVYTKQGIKRISTLTRNDFVLGDSGFYRPVKEVLIYESSQEKSISITIRHGSDPVTVTTGHPIYAIRNVVAECAHSRIYNLLEKGVYRPAWTEASELKVGDYVATPIPRLIEEVSNFDDDTAFVYGMMLGNGHMSRRGPNSIECGVSYNPNSNDIDHINFLKKYLLDRNIHSWNVTFDGRSNYNQIRWSYDSSMVFNDDDVYNINGLKHISPRFSHLPIEQTTRIIEGLIATDGCVSRNSEITFTNVSEDLIDNLRYQLIRLGVMSGLQTRKRQGSHIIERENGDNSIINFDNTYYDIRIPAFDALAKYLNISAVTKAHWLTYNGFVWSRIKAICSAETADYVYDLLVETDETYATVGALVHNGGKRKGAACVYLESHHPDIMQFLELRDNTGEKEQRAYNLNLANWVPDLLMKRVQEDGPWSLIDPSVAPDLTDLYGDAYEARVLEIEAAGDFVEQIPARKLYGRMMRTLAETGNGWMCFKDTSNKRGNQVGEGGLIHLSNLCTEILEVTSSGKKISMSREEMFATSASDLIERNIRVTGFNTQTDSFEAIEGMETAVCNLGSINIGRGYIKNNKLNIEKLHKNVAVAVKYLDRVIDRNFYPIHEAESSNHRWRPIGLGLMGLADLFFQLRLPFESDEAIALSATIQEEIYYQALKTSCELAKVHGAHIDFALTRAAKGDLQFDLAGVVPTDQARWNVLREDIKVNGLRNSLLIAIAPTATIAHITGAEECTEPVKANLLKRETLSGEFISINRYLVDDLKKLGRWDAEAINILKRDEGSIQKIEGLPSDLYALYKTVWEISQKKIIEHGAARGAYIDQSQSLNTFIDLNRYPEDKRIGVLSSLYMYAWEKGLKTTYYFRSRSASRIEKTTVTSGASLVPAVMAAENPEVCESCT
jgi:ribonucleoside-diphosphate reductase alpha chain